MNRSVVAVLALLVLFGGVVVLVIGPFGPTAQTDDTTVEPLWTSDTQRDFEANHHKIGATDDGDLLLAPVAVPAGHESIGSEGDHEHGDHEHEGHEHDQQTDDGDDASTPGGDGDATGDGTATGVAGACELVSLNRDGTVEWAYGIPPANCSAHAVTEPDFGDVNGDGAREIVFGTTENAVIVLDTDGEELRRIPLESYGHSRPTIGNVTPAPGPEIVASDIRGNVVVADRDGVVWRASVDGTAYPAPIIADVTGDDRPEVVITTSQWTVAFDRQGDRVWETATGGWTSSLGPDSETLYVGRSGEVVAIDGQTGEIDWEQQIDGTLAVGAVTESDGQALVYVGRNGGQVLTLNGDTGEVVLESERSTESKRRTPAPVLGDVTGDGSTEAVVVTNEGLLSVVDVADGSIEASYQTEVAVWVPVTLADLTGDGTSEILVRLGDGRVLALEVTE